MKSRFETYEQSAYGKGFTMVSASPLTRSSQHAGSDFEKLRTARKKQLDYNHTISYNFVLHIFLSTFSIYNLVPSSN